MSESDRLEMSRRGVIAAGAMTATAMTVSTADAQTAQPAPTSATVSLQVNGKQQTLTLDTRTTLLDALREQMQLTGTKKGCDHGQCGACTVLVNGIRINSCLTLAVMHESDSVTTVEGLGIPDKLHPMLPFEIGTPNNGGAVVTAGGLIFVAATTDNIFRAIDIRTGKTVWEDTLTAGGQATPMSYEMNGKQYIVVMAGGHLHGNPNWRCSCRLCVALEADVGGGASVQIDTRCND